jgi:hypothetical protein
MVEDLSPRLCNDGYEGQFPLFRLSARYWVRPLVRNGQYHAAGFKISPHSL